MTTEVWDNVGTYGVSFLIMEKSTGLMQEVFYPQTCWGMELYALFSGNFISWVSVIYAQLMQKSYPSRLTFIFLMFTWTAVFIWLLMPIRSYKALSPFPRKSKHAPFCITQHELPIWMLKYSIYGISVSVRVPLAEENPLIFKQKLFC